MPRNGSGLHTGIRFPIEAPWRKLGLLNWRLFMITPSTVFLGLPLATTMIGRGFKELVVGVWGLIPPTPSRGHSSMPDRGRKCVIPAQDVQSRMSAGVEA